MRLDNGKLRIKNSEMRQGWWIEDKQTRFEEFTMLHLDFIKIILDIKWCESRYFEDILKL